MKKINNIILMAGKGSRFAEQGYKLSKPLIPVSNKPMIVRAVESMPVAKSWTFVIREDHLDEKDVLDTLKSVSDNVNLIVDENPVGQLNSCLVAKDFYLNDEPMFIGACDLGMVYDKTKFSNLIESDDFDMVVFSFTNQPNLSRNPNAWGWLRVKEDNLISGVSVKVPISDTPEKDFAITGSFAFKSGEIFQKIADELIKREIKVKNEFYIDSMIEVAIDMGYKVVNFPIEKYIGWGTPVDYEEYVYFENALNNPEKYPEAKNKDTYLFWKDYFENNF